MCWLISLLCAEFIEYDRLLSCVICSNGLNRLNPTMSNRTTARHGV